MKKWGIVGLLAVALFAVVLWAGRDQGPAPVQLPDGTLLRIEAVTYGMDHAYTTDPPLLNWLRNHAPQPIRKRLNDPEFRATVKTEQETFVAWISAWNPVSGTYVALDSWQWHIVDEQGLEWSDGLAWGRGQSAKGRPMAWITCGTYPRERDSIQIRGSLSNAVVVLTVPNPKRVEPAVWEAQTLPATQRVGRAEVVLSGVRVSSGGKRFFAFPSIQVSTPELRVHDPKWVDATGNVSWQPFGRGPVWRLDVPLVTASTAPQAETNIVRLATSVMPGRGGFKSPELSTAAGATGLLHVGVTGPGSYQWSNGVYIAAMAGARGEARSPRVSHSNSSRLPAWWLRQCFVDMPALWLMSSDRAVLETGRIRARDQRGNYYANLRDQDGVSQEHTLYFRTALFDLPEDDGEVTFEWIPHIETNKVSFYVAMPEICSQ